MTSGDSPDPPDKAVFDGPPQIERLSARLARGPDEDVTDDEIVEVLGRGALDAFRFAQSALAGRVRKTTREPSFCHSADIALRAADLGFNSHTVQVCLLHDVVEDCARDLVDLTRHLDIVAERYGPDIAHDVRVLTNRYAMLLDAACGLLGKRVPVVQDSVPLVQDAVRRLRDSLPPATADAYSYEFYQVLGYFLPAVDMGDGQRKARIDHRYTIDKELRLLSYRAFCEEMADDARDHLHARSPAVYEPPLVVKGLDLVDNLRTTEVVSWHALERILVKAELFLDKTFFLHDQVRSRWLAGATFIVVYDYVKHHLAQQLAERRRVLGFLSDSRFAFLAAFLIEQIGRVQDKYRIERAPVEALKGLRCEIRQINGITDD